MAESLPGREIEPERLIGERIAGRFVVERLIGHGQLSTAFRAHDDRLHRRVTVKLFHPRHRDDVQVVESQLAAAKAVARLSHEHVAMVIDRGEHDGMPLIVLEHVRGENLQERIERYAPLAVGEVVGYALQIARALAYAHGHGVVHGNLRPGNVLLTEEREVKLVDFGGGSYVAQLVGDPYAAPELSEVDADAPPEAGDDIYALGALVFVALTEQAPVPDLDPAGLQLLRPDVSPRLASTIARSLAADPAERYISMRELAAELSAVREAMSPPTHGDSDAMGAFGTGQETQAFDVADFDLHSDEPADHAPVPTRRAPAARRAHGPKRRRTPHEARARLLAWSMVVAPLAALLIFGLMIAGERSRDQVDGDPATVAGPAVKAQLASATSFDPDGDDGEEHELEAANAIDGDRETTWQTSGYDTRDFNKAKPGVGLVVQLAEPAEVREVVIHTRLPGWRAEIRTAAEPAPTLDGWTRVSEPTAVESGASIPVDLEGDSQAQYLLLWITHLAIDVDDPNRSRARLSDIDVLVSTRESAGDTDG